MHALHVLNILIQTKLRLSAQESHLANGYSIGQHSSAKLASIEMEIEIFDVEFLYSGNFLRV